MFTFTFGNTQKGVIFRNFKPGYWHKTEPNVVVSLIESKLNLFRPHPHPSPLGGLDGRLDEYSTLLNSLSFISSSFWTIRDPHPVLAFS